MNYAIMYRMSEARLVYKMYRFRWLAKWRAMRLNKRGVEVVQWNREKRRWEVIWLPGRECAYGTQLHVDLIKAGKL